MVDPRQIIAGLVARGVPQSAAIGLAGNMAVESGFDPGINEINPIVEGSRGGFGLIQWTGPRRRQFESYAGQNVSDLDTQLDFLVHELNTTETRARDAIYSAQDPVEAARLVSDKFLRPGIPHLDRRVDETRKLMGYQPSPERTPQNDLTRPVEPPQVQNQLAAMQNPTPQVNPLNVNTFDAAPNALALRSFT